MKIPLYSRLIRRVSSLLPLSGLVPPPPKPEGISAMLRVWNEKDWLEDSIISIKDHVDEIVAVDTGSTDGSLEILERLEGKVKGLKVFRMERGSIWESSKFASDRTSFRWLLKWDADFVASADGMDGFAAHLRSLDPRLYYYINPKLIELTGDFGHQLPRMRVRGDIEAFTASPAAGYVRVDRTYEKDPYPVKMPCGPGSAPYRLSFEGVRLAAYYRITEYDGVVGYHVNVKPAIRHLLGYFYSQWLAEGGRGRLEEYAAEQAAARWGAAGLSQAAEMYMAAYARALSPYDDKLGPLPGNIRALAARSGYRVVYRDGRPVGRVE